MAEFNSKYSNYELGVKLSQMTIIRNQQYKFIDGVNVIPKVPVVLMRTLVAENIANNNNSISTYVKPVEYYAHTMVTSTGNRYYKISTKSTQYESIVDFFVYDTEIPTQLRNGDTTNLTCYEIINTPEAYLSPVTFKEQVMLVYYNGAYREIYESNAGVIESYTITKVG